MRPVKPIRGTVGQHGFMLLELLISMVVLSVGLGGLLALMLSAMYTDNRSGGDTSATMVAEHVLEQISAQPANASSTTLIPLTDCAANSWSISTQGAAMGTAGNATNGGLGANLTTGGVIDWTQDYASIPANYKMLYVACGAGKRQVTYDVRWDVMWNGYGSTYTQGSVYSQLVVISARPANKNMNGGLQFSMPANLRTIQGM